MSNEEVDDLVVDAFSSLELRPELLAELEGATRAPRIRWEAGAIALAAVAVLALAAWPALQELAAASSAPRPQEATMELEVPPPVVDDMASRIAPGMRAVSVALQPFDALVERGERVMLVMVKEEAALTIGSYTALATTASGQTTLEMSPKEAERLVHADSLGTLRAAVHTSRRGPRNLDFGVQVEPSSVIGGNEAVSLLWTPDDRSKTLTLFQGGEALSLAEDGRLRVAVTGPEAEQLALAQQTGTFRMVRGD